jgi:hypothetical protein
MREHSWVLHAFGLAQDCTGDILTCYAVSSRPINTILMELTIMFRIDDAFIERWQIQYAENDEKEYERLVAQIGLETRSTLTMSEESFQELYKWKTRNRTKRFLKIAGYQTLYAPAFKRCQLAPRAQKLAELVADQNKLPGIDTATATTIIHFLHPQEMPIMDVRTVQVLHNFGYISAGRVSFQAYEEFRAAIDLIARELPGRSYRLIDRALFAYHKKEFSPGKSSCD